MANWQEEHLLLLYNHTSMPENGTYVGPSRLATSLGAAIMLLFFVEGMFGNLWIVLAVLTKRHIWNIINLFIASLCFNELLTAGLIVSLIIDSYIWQEWTAGELMCKLNPEFTVAFTGCSLWHTAFIAIHRYIVVVHNNAYTRMSKKAYVCFVLVVARLIPFACTFPGFSLETSGYVPKLLRCILLPNQVGRMMTITLVQIVAPCIIVVLCYALVFAYVVKTTRQVNNTNRSLMMQREIRITKMFGVIFLMILLGFIPYAVVRNSDRANQLHADVYVIVTVCYGVATCSSPLIYGAMSTEIRSVCMTCLQQTCYCTRLFKCSPCLMMVDQQTSPMSHVEDATVMNEPETNGDIQVKDATTQIENGCAPGDKLIPMKDLTTKKTRPESDSMKKPMIVNGQGNADENAYLLQACPDDQEEENMKQIEFDANCNATAGSTSRNSVVEITGQDCNVEPFFMSHKDISCDDSAVKSPTMTEQCDSVGSSAYENKDCESGVLGRQLESEPAFQCTDTEVKFCEEKLGKTKVTVLQNGGMKSVQ